jgi:hypothetical protein
MKSLARNVVPAPADPALARVRLSICGLACLALGGLLLVSRPARGAGSSAGADAPPEAALSEQLDAALAARLAGDVPTAQDLLYRAWQAAPDDAALNWQQGRVHYEGQWRDLDEVARLVASDANYQEYARLCGSTEPTIEAQTSLARWCEDRALEQQAAGHWRTVLQLDPDNAAAQRALGLKAVDGRLLTDEEIAQSKADQAQRKRTHRRYVRQFERRLLRTDLGDPYAREALLDEIRSVRDAQAMAALEEIATVDRSLDNRLTRKLGIAKGQQFATDLQLAVVAAFDQIPAHEATQRLVRIALDAEIPAVRTAAAQALRTRRDTDYIPQLMGTLVAPIEAHIRVMASPDGTVSYDASYLQHGHSVDRRHTVSRANVIVASQDRNGNRDARGMLQTISRSTVQAERQAAAARAEVQATNLGIHQRNERVASALRTVTGKDLQTDPQQWWTAWQAYNEFPYSYEHPVYETQESSTSYQIATQSCECFAAGTPVCTPSGMVSIEQLRVGDLVLSQDPDSGELAFRPVLKTIVGPAPGFVRIRTPEETIDASPGHRFWIPGEGWQMAKFLTRQTELHALESPLPVRGVDPLPAGTSYNLVVDEFHTYFVSSAKILVHDIGCPRPTESVLPGLANSVVEAKR